MASSVKAVPFQEQKSFQDKLNSFQPLAHSKPSPAAAQRRRSSVTDVKVLLNSGHYIPLVALGVAKTPNDANTVDFIKFALEAGYRHIDSAARYANEESVGRAVYEFVKTSGVPREDVFVTSKLWDDDHGRPTAAIDESLKKLNLDYMDLYLMHSPGADRNTRLQAWKEMEDAVYAGKIKSIGVSNFDVDELDDLLGVARIKPAVNQIESHPFFQQEDLRKATIERGIHVQAYSPMAQGAALERPEILAIAKKHGKSSAQVLLKWGINVGNIILPKSMTRSRIAANADVFDFELDQGDMNLLNNLDEGLKVGRLGPKGTSNPNSRRSSATSSGTWGGKLQMSSS